MTLTQEILTGVINAASIQTSVAVTNLSFSNFDQRAEAGESLTVAFFGGSLTWGARASDPQKTSYRALISAKLTAKYPKAHFSFVDAAIGGTGSLLGVFRLQRDVLNNNPDLVFLDFTLNDDVYVTTLPTLAAFESLVHRIITEGHCPVVVMFLASREHVEDGTPNQMVRYHEHMKIVNAYQTGLGDAIVLMQHRLKEGKIDLDTLWPPESLDTCHPYDPGYALYAEAGWNGYLKAVNDDVVCTPPKKKLFGESFTNWKRIDANDINPLPQGWKTSYTSRDYCAFDFLTSRWLENVAAAANYKPIDRKKTEPLLNPILPLQLHFHGSSVLLFGESTPRSSMYRIIIDGDSQEFNACQLGSGVGRFLQQVAVELDPVKEHTLEIVPLFSSPEDPQEFRLGFIGIAGPGKVDFAIIE